MARPVHEPTSRSREDQRQVSSTAGSHPTAAPHAAAVASSCVENSRPEK